MPYWLKNKERICNIVFKMASFLKWTITTTPAHQQKNISLPPFYHHPSISQRFFGGPTFSNQHSSIFLLNWNWVNKWVCGIFYLKRSSLTTHFLLVSLTLTAQFWKPTHTCILLPVHLSMLNLHGSIKSWLT